MTKESLIKSCNNFAIENNIRFNHYEDTHRDTTILKFHNGFNGFSIDLKYNEIRNINCLNEFLYYLTDKLKLYKVI